MPKFTKKPVEVEARQFDGTQASAKAVCAWMAAYGCEALRAFCGHDEPYQVYISTLEGRMTASAGDWIIRGVKGEFYPCKPDIFAATYEDAAIALMRGQSDMVLVPRELTYENGAKAAFMGEFFVETTIPCGDCDGSGYEDEDGDVPCVICDGEGYVPYRLPVGWTLVKDIHKAIIAHFHPKKAEGHSR